MATSISSIGVGSGLPLDTLLQQLRTAENAPLAALQGRATKEQQRFTAYGTLKSALETVSTAAQALGKSETFNGVKASVTGDTFTATTKSNSGAVPGNYSVKVNALAQAQILTSSGATQDQRSKAIVHGEGTINIEFSFGDSEKNHTLSIDPSKSSLEDIVKAINADPKLGVTATLINDGSPDAPHRLMISANDTGADNALTSIKVSLANGNGSEEQDNELDTLSGFLNFDAPTPTEEDGYPVTSSTATSMGQSVAARNASVTVNGIEIQSQKNTLEDAIDGVTLTLTKEAGSSDAANMLRVTRDDTVTTTAVTNFVNAYNALQTSIKSLTAYNTDTQSSAALTGDSLARRAQTQVRDAINGLAIDGVTLSSLGIKTDPTTGNLSVDNAKLTEALNKDRAAFERLFASDSGLSKRVNEAVEVFTKSDGLIKTSQDSITRTLKLLEGQYEQMEARIDQKMENYRAQFVQLDSFMAQMNGISSYLGSQLSMLENLSSSASKK